ncbi:MAG: terminase gpA endonuclease subunit [Pirellulaceae bacterium]
MAADEWKAAQIEDGTEEKEDAEKELCQQVWCIPYSLPMVEHSPLRRTDVRRRRHELPSGVVPADCVKLTAGVDVGKWVCWYFVIATRANGSLHCVTYGSRDTGLNSSDASSKLHEKNAIKNCLRGIFDFMDKGFGVESGGIRSTDLTIVDAGYMPDAVYEVIRERDRQKFMACLGRGRTQLDSRKYEQPRNRNSTIRFIGDRHHIEWVHGKGLMRIVFDADDSKLSIQACLRVTPGSSGALTLPAAPEREHITVARHLASEVYRRYLEPGKGIKEEWTKKGANHFLDCAGMALVGQKKLGWKLPETVQKVRDRRRATRTRNAPIDSR